MQCPNCGKNLTTAARFCTGCGQPTAAPAPPAPDPGDDFDATFNPYESVAQQRAEIAQQTAPPPAPEPEPQQPPPPQTSPPEAQQTPQQQPPAGYQPSFGENFRMFLTEPTLFFTYNHPSRYLAAGIIIVLAISAIQASVNMFFYSFIELSHQSGQERFLYKAVSTAGYPIVTPLLAWMLIAARRKGLPSLRAVFCIYSLGFFAYLMTALPLPMGVLGAALLCTLHLRAGLDKTFGLSPTWQYSLALGLPLLYWLAAGFACNFTIFF